ncbi:MAG: murein biosynthesis integral membrane protein MurJ, partial [Chloroflexota bacterium]|nr:murein biosynthesis integral membrane protein MurJ [Chloroflexota bacterium]
LVGVAAVGVYFLVAVALVRPLGMLGLVLANSAQFAAHAGVMWALARRGFDVGDRALARTATRCVVAALGTAAATFISWRALLVLLPGPAGETAQVVREVVLVAMPVTVGGLVYVLALHALRVEELALLRRALLGRVLPRFAG